MRPALALLLVLACTPADTTDTTAAGTTTAADSTSAAASTSSAATTSVDPTTGDDPATTAPSTTTTADTTDAATDATTGEPGFCWGWNGADGPPYMDLHDKDGNLLTSGSPLPLECGGQGSFMFGLYPTFGGFTPTGDILEVALVVDVDGFNDNPEGHFYSADPVAYYVACDDVIGGVYGVIPVFPFDNLGDLMALDGQPAQIHLTVPTGDEPLAVDLDVVLSVTPDDSWSFCGG